MATELLSNGLGQFPGALFQAQADSPIHWQPWTPETLARAKAAQRLIFGVIVVPQQPGYQSVLRALSTDSKLVTAIHENYVPMLIDGDTSREMGLLTSVLCAEVKRPVQLPLFVWMTSEGAPVAWTPVSSLSSKSVSEVFNQMHSTVSRLWSEDAGYVMKNGGLDQEGRRNRMLERKAAQLNSENPKEDAVSGLRQLASLYDTLSGTFDETGGLFPASALELLATSAIQPSLPADLQAKCLATTRYLLNDLLPSPMFDPLDGGAFSSRVGKSWALPLFHRDCGSQARAGVALLSAYRATGDPRALDKVQGLISFAEKSYATPEGLFAAGLVTEANSAAWLWTVEDIRKVLSAEDAAWWIRATGMQGLGNLPPEVDPFKEYFRSNTLGLKKSVAEIAAELGQTVEVFLPRFQAARDKLLSLRNSRLGSSKKDDCSHAGSSFRMVSLYAAAYAATGDAAFREKAVSLLERCQASFTSGPKLRMFTQDAPASIGAGRAFLYGLAIQAALDVSAITTDGRWSAWSDELSTTAAELFHDETMLRECPENANLMALPVTDLVMLFDDSSTGLFSLAAHRLAQAGHPVVQSLRDLVTQLPAYSVERPMLYTDLIQASIARHFEVVLITGADLPAEMKLAIERMPLRMIQRRAGKKSDAVPSGAVKVILGNSEPTFVSDLQSLQRAVLPVTP